MELQMKPIEGLTEYWVREDGVIICPNGRIIERPYRSGQVSLKDTAYDVQVSKSLAKIVAEAFIPKPTPFHTYVWCNDGDKTNCHVDNLSWHTSKQRRTLTESISFEMRDKIVALWSDGRSVNEICRAVSVKPKIIEKVVMEYEEIVRNCP